MKTRSNLRRIIAFVLSMVSVLALSGGASADTAASIQNGWLSYRNGGSLYIPDGFTLPCNYHGLAAHVWTDGSLGDYGVVINDRNTVRPAFWINLEFEIF